MSGAVEMPSGEVAAMTPELRKSFNLLKSHASKVANFALQWQDLEDCLRSIDDSLQSRIDLLQQTLTLPEPESEPNSKPEPESEPNSKPEPPSQECINFDGAVVRDGDSLLALMNARDKERDQPDHRDVVSNAIKGSLPGCARIVLDAMRRFYSETERKVNVKVRGEVGVVKRSCLVLLEEMAKAKPLMKIGDEVRSEAVRLAVEWRGRTKSKAASSIELWAFLMLVAGFGLEGEFDMEEIFNLVGSVAVRKQSPELFRALGFTERAPEFIQKLVSQKMRIEAVKFIHAFELLDKFPPMPLLEAHINFAKKEAKTSLKRGQDNRKEEAVVVEKELVALIAVMRCVEIYKLEVEPQYTPENLKKRIHQLEKKKIDFFKIKRKKKIGIKVSQPSRVPENQGQNLSGQKRTSPQVQAPNKNNNKRHRTDRAAVRNASFRAPTTAHSIHPSYLRHVDLYESHGVDYLTASAGMPRQGADPPLTSYGTASPSYNSLRASHYQSIGSYKGEGAEYATRYYDSAHSIPDAHVGSSAGHYTLVSSSPITHNRQAHLTDSSPLAQRRHITEHMNTSTASYRLGDSTFETMQLSPLCARYGSTSMAVNGRTRQFGSAGSPQPAHLTILSQNSSIPGDTLPMANHNDRSVSSSSGYGNSNQYQPSIYHL